MLKKFAVYYKNHWKLFLLDIAGAFIMSGLDLAFPVIMRTLIDQHFPDKNINMIMKMVIILFILYLLRYVFQYIVHYWGHVVGIRMEYDMRRDIFTHLQTLPFRFFDKTRTGKIMSR